MKDYLFFILTIAIINFNKINEVATLLKLVFIQKGTNLLNDYFYNYFSIENYMII